MAKYCKKPVEIEAIQWNGTNESEIKTFVGDAAKFAATSLTIETLEGTMTAQIGDFIIRGVDGEFYPCKPDIFERTYDKVD